MKKIKILCLVSLLVSSVGIYANTIESFDEEFSVCNAASSIFCTKILNQLNLKNSGYGQVIINFRTKSADEEKGIIKYKVEFDNSTKCDITIGSTLLKHGSNVGTLDWGLIKIPARSSKTSKTHTFHFSKRDKYRFEQLVFSYNGLANCPD